MAETGRGASSARSLVVFNRHSIHRPRDTALAGGLYKIAHLERLNSFPGQDLIKSQVVDLGLVANGEVVTANDRTADRRGIDKRFSSMRFHVTTRNSRLV
jgi:hypothetical protein